MSFKPIKAFSYAFRSTVEYELVNTFYTLYDGIISPDPIEIQEGRFWPLSEIGASLKTGVFTPNFVQEFERIKALLYQLINQK